MYDFKIKRSEADNLLIQFTWSEEFKSQDDRRFVPDNLKQGATITLALNSRFTPVNVPSLIRNIEDFFNEARDKGYVMAPYAQSKASECGMTADKIALWPKGTTTEFINNHYKATFEADIKLRPIVVFYLNEQLQLGFIEKMQEALAGRCSGPSSVR